MVKFNPSFKIQAENLTEGFWSVKSPIKSSSAQSNQKINNNV